MKKNIYVLLAGAAIMAACQKHPSETTLKGDITGVESDTLLVNYFSVCDFNRKNVQRDTIAMQQGKFTYTLPADSVPTEIWLYAKPAGNKAYDMLAHTNVLLFPGQTVTLTGSLKECITTGNAFHQELEKVKLARRSIQQEIDSISKVMVKMQKEKAPQAEVQKIYQEQMQPLFGKIKEVQLQYIKAHPNSDAALYLLAQMGPKVSKEYLPQLSQTVKEGVLAPIYQQIQSHIQREEAFEKAKKNVEVGKQAPDFTLTDIQGKPFTLTSLRGKYVVLDFWGSWCGWCIKGLPEMKKYYQKYQKQMEIVGIDCRDTEEKWKESVKRHELPWIHVRNDEQTDVTLLYAVKGFPTKIVIDPDGKINQVVVGEDPAFYKYLDKLFK